MSLCQFNLLTNIQLTIIHRSSISFQVNELILFLAVFGLCCCAQASSSWEEQLLLFCGFSSQGSSWCRAQAQGRVGCMSSSVWAQGCRGLRSCGAQAQLLRSVCNLPEPGIGLMSPEMEGRLLSTVPLLLLSHFNRVRFCVTPQTAAHQAPLSLGFSRQEHCSGLPFPSPKVWLNDTKSDGW